MYLWRRRASQKWSDQNEEQLRTIAGDRLAIIQQPNRKLLQFELGSNQRDQLERIAERFGGRIEKLPRDWLKRALRRKTKPIRIGSRLLKIPAGAAFGTGEHATTAMSLRLLEKLSRSWNRNWSVVDLGTGSGILALAAKCLGARTVVGVDNDPVAISTAKQNAQLNKINGVSFRVTDVRNCKLPSQVDVVTANLFSELLIETLPKIRPAGWLILSGILRAQERDVRRALTRDMTRIVEVRRRGKWVAILAANS